MTIRWNCWRPDGDLRPFGAAEVARDECRHLARHGSGLRPAAGLRRLGHGPLLATHDLRPARRGRRQSGRTEARDVLNQALYGGDRSCLEASPCPRACYRKAGLGFGSERDIRVARKRVLRLMRENNLLSPHRCRRRGGNPHDGEIITHARRTAHVGHRWRSGVHGGRRLGLDLHRRRALERRVCRLACLQARRPLRPLRAHRSPWGLPGCQARPRPARLGGCALQWITAPISVGGTSPTRSGVLTGHPAVLRLRRRAPDQRRRRAVQSHAEGTDLHGRICNIAELRDAVRDFVELYNAQGSSEKSGYLSPAQARQAWHAAISIRPAPRETNLCPRNRVRHVVDRFRIHQVIYFVISNRIQAHK